MICICLFNHSTDYNGFQVNETKNEQKKVIIFDICGKKRRGKKQMAIDERWDAKTKTKTENKIKDERRYLVSNKSESISKCVL